MYEVKLEFERRKEEILEYYEFILKAHNAKLLHQNTLEPIKVATTKTMKSTLYLILYNIVESTISMCLREIHENINNDKLKYSHLNYNIRELYSDYFMSLSRKSRKEFISKVNKDEFIQLDFDKIQKELNLFSGNLDKRKVNDISKLYNIKIKNDRFGKSLLSVKSIRNSLAHGNVSFSQCCKDIIIESLKQQIDDVINFLDLYINCIEEYLLSKSYKDDKITTDTSIAI